MTSNPKTNKKTAYQRQLLYISKSVYRFGPSDQNRSLFLGKELPGMAPNLTDIPVHDSSCGFDVTAVSLFFCLLSFLL